MRKSPGQFVIRVTAGAVTVAGTVRSVSTGNGDYLTIRYGHDGGERWRHRFGGRPDPGQQDEVAGLAIDGEGDALVTGTSWNGYVSTGGTANDIVTVRFPAGAAPALTAPSQLDATAPSASGIRLRWQDDAGTEDGFRVERCAGTGCTAFAQIAVVGRDVTSYVDIVWETCEAARSGCRRGSGGRAPGAPCSRAGRRTR